MSSISKHSPQRVSLPADPRSLGRILITVVWAIGGALVAFGAYLLLTAFGVDPATLVPSGYALSSIVFLIALLAVAATATRWSTS